MYISTRTIGVHISNDLSIVKTLIYRKFESKLVAGVC